MASFAVFVFFFSWRVNAVRIAAILTKEAYLDRNHWANEGCFFFLAISSPLNLGIKIAASTHEIECSGGLCSCSEDDTIFTGKIWHIFGYVNRLSVGSTGAVLLQFLF